MRKIKFLILSMFFFCCLFTSTGCFAAEKEQITITILKGDNLNNYKQQISKALKEKLNKEVVIKVLNYDIFMIDMDRGNSDFYKGSPLTYVYSLSNTVILKSLYKINDQWKTCYLPVILARKDRNINTIQDLQGKKFYFTNQNSASGYLYPKLFLIENNITIEKEFANDNSPSAKDVYNYVISGKWDACCSFYGLFENDPLFKDDSLIRIIESPVYNENKWINGEFQNKYMQTINFVKENLMELFDDDDDDIYGLFENTPLFQDNSLFQNNSLIKVFEINSPIPNDPLWVNREFQKKYPEIVNVVKETFLELFKDNETIRFAPAKDSDYNSIRRKVRILGIIENKDFISVDKFLGLFTKNPRILDFVLKYSLHIILVNLIFVAIIIIIVYIIFKKTIVKKYYSEHKLLNDKYNDLLKHLKEENDFNLKITKLENEIKIAFKDFSKFVQDSIMVKYVATGEFLYNKYKNTNAMEPSAIANCYVKAFERIVMVSAYGFETFEKQDDIKVPDEQQNIKNKIDPKKILDNGIRDIREKANLNNREYKSLQKCKSIRNKVAHLKPVSTEEVVSIRKTLLGEIPYTNGILAKLAPYL
ncbi:phosphate/phosphite/phosphonate ABC transporter substrate-binding protein [Candidatus Ruminimicrobium bovinum]|uniref:phosphate/phosphite/phosphonate ABC transporter substrate-binding protein n=1 Tax=Candidatus Ruminimicrobium bovinum TaxID=3242779 RepID=UPI0039B90A14